MLNEIFKNIGLMSITGSFIILVILLIYPVSIKIFSARWNYHICILALMFLIIPVGCLIEKSECNVYNQTIIESINEIDYFNDSTNFFENAQLKEIQDKNVSIIETVNKSSKIKFITNKLYIIWIVGVFVFFLIKFIRVRLFRSQLIKTSFKVEKTEYLYRKLNFIKEDMGLKKKPLLLTNDLISSPMIIGVFSKVLILPEIEFTENELSFIFKHELTHIKKRDLSIKLFAFIINGLHWFNPFVYIIVNHINKVSELACDESVVNKMTKNEKILYGKTILNVVAKSINQKKYYGLALGDTKKGIKRRLNLIMKIKNKSKKRVLISFVILGLVAMVGSTFAYVISPKIDKIKDYKIEEIKNDVFKEEIIKDSTLEKEIIEKEVKEVDFNQKGVLEFFEEVKLNENKVSVDTNEKILIKPVKEGIITSPYGSMIHPITRENKIHTGIDYAMTRGTEIVAADSGEVIGTEENSNEESANSYGKFIIIKHDNGAMTLYAHCSKIMLKKGDLVKQGEKIAEVGSTGQSTGNHCHFEYRINGEHVDPLLYMEK